MVKISSDDLLFITAPRELSVRRFTDIVKRYLPKGNILLGIAEEPYVTGFENQPQFRMLRLSAVQSIIDKVEASSSPHKIRVVPYAQSELAALVDQLRPPQRVLLVNGSWQYAFHHSRAYSILVEHAVPMKFISPFVDETEARDYERTHTPEIALPALGSLLSEAQMMQAADAAARQSFDNSFQTGVSLGRGTGDAYVLLETAFNQVIPYQTYAFHHGNSREIHRSQPHDTNHYDTIHAEMQLLTKALTSAVDLAGTTLFLNLLPCPNCARTLSQTPIAEIVYRHDHSDGYAVKLLEACGKRVRKALQW